MCGSASERTRAISWGEMVIEEFPGCGGGAASGNIAAPFSEPPARAKEGSVADTGARVFVLVMPGQKRVEDARKRAYDPGIHRKSISSKEDGLPGQARQ